MSSARTDSSDPSTPLQRPVVQHPGRREGAGLLGRQVGQLHCRPPLPCTTRCLRSPRSDQRPSNIGHVFDGVSGTAVVHTTRSDSWPFAELLGHTRPTRRHQCGSGSDSTALAWPQQLSREVRAGGEVDCVWAGCAVA